MLQGNPHYKAVQDRTLYINSINEVFDWEYPKRYLDENTFLYYRKSKLNFPKLFVKKCGYYKITVDSFANQLYSYYPVLDEAKSKISFSKPSLRVYKKQTRG